MIVIFIKKINYNFLSKFIFNIFHQEMIKKEGIGVT